MGALTHEGHFHTRISEADDDPARGVVRGNPGWTRVPAIIDLHRGDPVPFYRAAAGRPPGGARGERRTTAVAMPLFLREDDVARLLSIDDVIPAVEGAFREHGEGRAINRPRQRTVTERAGLHAMSGGVPATGATGGKEYNTP